ncbi:hepcidin [Nannospalax galili]|uniref:Hepcidin n=1 Tax=Nannospalax galili TaxID=1026970 RepID=A0A8C6R7V0_NANGA|nr:hepcidin [Nannospalax galili]
MMALNAQIRVFCLLLLLLASLTSGTVLQQQMSHITELQPRYTEEAKASRTLLFQRRRKRDTHFPLCMYCCKCCKNRGCGVCCIT